jgi:hypothetical protein
MSETMNPQISEKKNPKISEESARAQVVTLFEAFEKPLEVDGDEPGKKIPDPYIAKLAEAVVKGRLEINGTGDEIEIKQHLRKSVNNKSSLDWNWYFLGLGKSRVKVDDKGIVPFTQAYTVASPMTGLELKDIYKMHPNDLSLLEDIAGFFQRL